MIVNNIKPANGGVYDLGHLKSGDYQYQDRYYQFDYVPEELEGITHIKTCGNDKLISENDECFSFECHEAAEVYILYADKFPYLPKWLETYERLRMNVTRMDSIPGNLKGYFSVYKKLYKSGIVTLNGCSPEKMLSEEWYVTTKGANYCMYSVCVWPIEI